MMLQDIQLRNDFDPSSDRIAINPFLKMHPLNPRTTIARC